MHFHRPRAAVPFALVIALMLATSGIAQADHSWGSYHWARQSSPFTLKLGDNMSGTWDAHLVTASGDWSASSVLDTTIVAGGTKPRACKPTSGRVEVCNAAYGKNGWLGLAQIWISGSHIVQGVTKMNDTYFKLAAYDNPSERLHVVCQEIGHTFGLDHQDESGKSLGTCMDYYRNTTNDGISTQPNAHDYEQLETIYAHLDSFSTVKSAADSKKGVPVDGEDEDGTPKGASPERGSKYVQDLGGGKKLVTHVYWVSSGR